MKCNDSICQHPCLLGFWIKSVALIGSLSMTLLAGNSEQLWRIQINGSQEFDSIRIVIEENQSKDYTVREYLNNVDEPISVSRYLFSPDKGYEWRGNYSTCDTMKILGENNICQAISRLPTKIFSFTALGNTFKGTNSCSVNLTCEKPSYFTITWMTIWTTVIDSISENSSDGFLFGYKRTEGDHVSGRFTNATIDSFVFKGNAQCVQFKRGKYTNPNPWSTPPEVSAQFFPEITGELVSNRSTEIQTARHSIATKSKQRVFHSIKQFESWRNSFGGKAVRFFNANGKLEINPPYSKPFFLMVNGDVYFVFVLEL